MPSPRNPTLAAAACIAGYAGIVGFVDNFVRIIAEDAGLWQFHAVRAAMALAMLGLAAVPLGLALWPLRPGPVAARSLVHGTAMLLYFGCLAFLPVAQVAAGLFTAPVFVVLIGRIAYGRAVSGWQVAGIVIGFAGVLMVLGPEVAAGASLAALIPVLAGALYAMGNIATREWCSGERAEVLLAGFFAVLGIYGLAGLAVLWLAPLEVPPGAAGFVLRGAVSPNVAFWVWTFAQAAGSLIGVALMIRAYQIADAARVSVMEYMILPASAFWGWVVWGDRLTPLAVAGMGLIAVAGVIVARPQSPSAARQ